MKIKKIFLLYFRATFGQNVGPFRKQVGNGVEFYFEGMSPRGSSAPVVQVASVSPMSPTPAIEAPGSPILKAQLCAPPKANNRKDILKPVSFKFLPVWCPSLPCSIFTVVKLFIYFDLQYQFIQKYI